MFNTDNNKKIVKNDKAKLRILKKVLEKDGISRRQLIPSVKISRDLWTSATTFLELCKALVIDRGGEEKTESDKTLRHHITEFPITEKVVPSLAMDLPIGKPLILVVY